MLTFLTSGKFTRARGLLSTISLCLALAFLLNAGVGCDTGVDPALSAEERGEANTEASSKAPSLCPAGQQAVTAFQGRSLSLSEGATACLNAEGVLIAEGRNSNLLSVGFDISGLDSTHVFFEPVRVPADGSFVASLNGAVEGESKTLVSTALVPQADGSKLIEARFEDTHEMAGDSLQVSFLWQGKVLYQTRLPIQARLPIAFYNRPGSSATKTTAQDDDPTSGYWAYIDGTWVWMVDWTEGEGGGKRVNPAILTPAFPAPLNTIPVDYLRIEFSFDTPDVSAATMKFTSTGIPRLFFTKAEI